MPFYLLSAVQNILSWILEQDQLVQTLIITTLGLLLSGICLLLFVLN